MSFNFLKKFDILGLETGFEFMESTRYKTWFGTVLTILAFISVTVISFMFGKEVWQRKSPNVSSSESYEISNINLDSFKFWLYAGSEAKVETIDISDYFDIQVTYLQFNIDKLSYDFSLTLNNCTEEYAGKWSTLNGVSNVTSISLCPNLNQTLSGNYSFQNPYLTADSSTIIISFSKCNSLYRQCPADIEEIFSSILILFYYIDSYIDSSDYNTPVKYYLNTKSQSIIPNFAKEDYFSFSMNKYNSDNGWIFEDIQEFVYIELTSLTSDMIAQSFPGETYSIFLQTSNLATFTSRNYMKVQDLFAKIGGIINAILVIITTISYHYINYMYVIDVSKRYNSNIEDSSKGIIHLKEGMPIKEISANSNSKVVNNNYIIKKSPKISLRTHNQLANEISKSEKIQINNLMGSEINNVKLSEEVKENESMTKIPLKKNDNNIDNCELNIKSNNFIKSHNQSEICIEKLKLDYNYIEYIFSMICCNSSIKMKYKKQFEISHKIMDITKYITFISSYYNIHM